MLEPGAPLSMSRLIGSPVGFYFYPKDDTPGDGHAEYAPSTIS